MPKPQIREMRFGDLSKVKTFTDQQIGTDYYQTDELEDVFTRSQKNGLSCSFVLMNQEQVVGVRLSFPPGQWHQGKGQGLSPKMWPHPPEETAYFQSLFIESKHQGQGWDRCPLMIKSSFVVVIRGTVWVWLFRQAGPS